LDDLNEGNEPSHNWPPTCDQLRAKAEPEFPFGVTASQSVTNKIKKTPGQCFAVFSFQPEKRHQGSTKVI
jgi:hypothetical protein